MKCPSCDTELRIIKSAYVTERDDTPDAPTRLFIEQSLACRNRNCENENKIVSVTRNEIPIG